VRTMATSVRNDLSGRDGPPFTVTIQESVVGHVVLLRGELDLATGEGLADRICAAAGSRVVLDLSGLTFIDSSGIAELLHTRGRLASKGDEPLFVNPSPRVGRILELTGLSSLIRDDPGAS
jgi:anti-sigma B factor antagonist